MEIAFGWQFRESRDYCNAVVLFSTLDSLFFPMIERNTNAITLWSMEMPFSFLISSERINPVVPWLNNKTLEFHFK
jgi:hypothetical protein